MQIDVRGTDVVGNRNDDRSTWPAWRGEIDTLAPRVTIIKSGRLDWGQVNCTATDFNLVLNNYHCDCMTTPDSQVTYDQVSEWYRQTFSDKSRLYQTTNSVIVSGGGPFSTQACDKYGHCATASTSGAALAGPPQPLANGAVLHSMVLTPTDKTVLTNLTPLTVTVVGAAPAYLRDLTLHLDGAPQHTWHFPAGLVTQTVTSTVWTPPVLTDGAHALTTVATDWAGQTQTETITTTLIVDQNPPTMDVSPVVLTTTHQLPYPGVNLGGPVADAAGLKTVEVSIDGGAWTPVFPHDGQWQYAWYLGGAVDGVAYTVAARATDLGDHVVQATGPVTVDIAGPAPVTVTLAYTNSAGVLTPVLPGQTIRDVLNPTLVVQWTASSDGSGLSHYRAGLTTSATPDPAALPLYPAAGPRVHTQAAPEASAYWAHVMTQDTLGNRSWNTLGPVYVDTPQTPDYISLSPRPGDEGIYHGWLDSGCSQIGVNRIVSETASPIAALQDVQRFYVTWDATALRLTWTGANWDGVGDLFIYLNAQPGQGTIQAYNPYPVTASSAITLPMRANWLVWVKDTRTAQLYPWSGSGWGAPQDLSAFYRFASGADADYTDLLLPFSLLGIADPTTTPLDMVAFGSENDALRVWAVMPPTNPHNSPILGNPSGTLPPASYLTLQRFYHWDRLDAGSCPNTQYPDVDVRARLTVEPWGLVVKAHLNGPYWAEPIPRSTRYPIIGHGQLVTYTLQYENRGTATVPNARLVITTHGSLILSPGADVYTRQIDLGDLLPGVRGTAVFSGVVDTTDLLGQYAACRVQHPHDPQACAGYLDLARLARAHAAVHTDLGGGRLVERLTAEHIVDVDPPTDVAVVQTLGVFASSSDAGRVVTSRLVATHMAPPEAAALAQPPIYVQPGVHMLQGTVYDPAGAPTYTLQVLDPQGDVHESFGTDATPTDGMWVCLADLTANTGDRLFVRARATDAHGNSSEWSAWRVFIVDAQPPTAALDARSVTLVVSTTLAAREVLLGGQVWDNLRASQVEVCLCQPSSRLPYVIYLPLVNKDSSPIGGAEMPVRAPLAATGLESCQLINVHPGDAASGTWAYRLVPAGGLDMVYQTLMVYGRDAAGNRSTTPAQYTLRLDTAAPVVVTGTQTLSVSLTTYQAHPTPLLSGMVTDGSGTATVVIHLASALTGRQRFVVATRPGAWSFTPSLTQSGVYTLLVEARDSAGNAAYLRPLTLVVSP